MSSAGKKKKKRPAPMVLIEEKIGSMRLDGQDPARMEKFLEAKMGILGTDGAKTEFTFEQYQTLFEDKQILAHGLGDARTIKLVEHKLTHKNYLKKVIHKDRDPTVIKQIADEIGIMHECIDKHCVEFYCSFIHNDEVTIIMEYMNGACLDSMMRRMGRIDETELGYMMMCSLKGMEYLASKAITHRDIKPSNILVNTRGDVKLCDFGVSKKLNDQRTMMQQLSTFVGTLAYMSPERLNNGEYTARCDIWSIGLSVFELAMGYHPFLLGDDAATSSKKRLPPPVARKDPRAPGWKKEDRVMASAVPTEIMGIVNDKEVNISLPETGPVKFSRAMNDYVAKTVIINPSLRISLKESIAHPWLVSCHKKVTYLDLADYVRLSLPADPDPGSSDEEEELLSEEEEDIDRSTSVVSGINPDLAYQN